MADNAKIIGFDVNKHNALAVVLDEVGRPVPDELDRFGFPSGLDDTDALDTLMKDAAQHFRRLNPQVVALCDTTKTNRWALTDLRPRIQMETALQLAAANTGCRAQLVSPHDVARALETETSGYELADAVVERVHLSGYTYPARRALAVGAAWYAAGIVSEGMLADE